mgnify:FL=1
MKSTLTYPSRRARLCHAGLFFGVFLSCTILPAQVKPDSTAPVPEKLDDETIVLSPFVVDDTKDKGYQATSTLAGTRIRTDLRDVGSSISVVTGEMLKDLAATNNESLLTYAINTEVGGPRGNFSGGVKTGTYQEQNLFVNPNANTRVRGLTNADNTRNYFISDVPWDGYTVSRVDLLRGPNAILFGLGSPAGVVNATTNDAILTSNKGRAEATFDKYGSQRYVLDYNQQLLPDELALRFTLLENRQQFQQDPAFSNDKRGYSALKYATKFLNKNGNHLTLTANIEKGEISSNRPRTVTPSDQTTAFWDPISQGGVEKKTFNFVSQGLINDQTVYNHSLTFGIPGDILQEVNSNNQPSWDKSTLDAYRAYRADGSVINDLHDQISNSHGGIFPAGNIGPGNRAVLNNFTTFAGSAGLPFAAFGSYANKTLTDPSVFDFYHKLLDGDNKREWNNWTVYNIDLSNTFLNDQIGYDLGYFRQHLRSGGWSALGWDNTIYLDINENNLDGTPNRNVGRAYVQNRNLDNNSETISDREAKRLQVFGEYDFAKKHDGVVARVLGLQRFTGVVSEEGVKTDGRSFYNAGLDPASLALISPSARITGAPVNNGIDTGYRAYLSGDLRNQSSASGSNLGSMPSFLPNSGGAVNLYHFDNTWIAGSGVGFGDPWANPQDPTNIRGPYTQANNPANYRGWVTTPVNVVTAWDSQSVNGQSARDYLTSTGSLNEFNVNSQVAVYQGYFWDRAIIGTYGYRRDRARNYAFQTSDRNGNSVASTGEADLNPSTYNYSNSKGNLQYLETTTKNWSVVAHVNRLFGHHDPLPFNLSFSYNDGENFQPLAGRLDAFNQPLAAPSGKTKEESVLISTKDDRYSLRLTKYKTQVLNGNTTADLSPFYYGVEGTLADGATYARQYRGGAAAYADYTASGGDANLLQNSILPAWFQFEKDLQAKFPAFVKAWINKDGKSSWGTDSNNFGGTYTSAAAPAGFSLTEDSVSKGYELELTANPTKNWRIAINGSKTEATRSNVPGEAFKSVLSFITDKIENTDAGLIPGWWAQNTFGIRNVGYWTSIYGPWLQVNALNGQSAGEVRQWHGNLVTNYDFSTGSLKGVGVGAGYRYESKAIIAYAPMVNADGSYGINLDAPFYAKANNNIDLWLSYERRLSKAINWRVQLNVFNVGGKNELIPFSASVDYAKLQGVTTFTPTTVIPMKASAFTIHQGMSWQISNTFEF